jgi:uncharacterized protein
MTASTWRHIGAATMLLLLAGFWYLAGSSGQHGSQTPFLIVTGALFGLVLQRSRLCFFCVLRDLFEFGNGRPAAGLVTALLVGSIGYIVLFGNWIADPSGGYLPQDAHIGPVSWHLLLGGLLFGWGMALSGSCISAHLYRLGEGYTVAPFALAGSAAGFILGFMAWNRLYVATVSTSPVIWLPEYGGYAVWTLVQLAVLASLALWLLIRFRQDPAIKPSADSECDPAAYGQSAAASTRKMSGTPRNTSTFADCSDPSYSGSFQPGRSGSGAPTLSSVWNRVFVDRWPTWVGGVVVGLLSMIAYLRVEPLGVTAELGRYSRQLGNRFDLLPERLEGLDGFAGCSTAAAPEVLTGNGIFVLALVAGSLFAALLSGRFRPSRLTTGKALKGFAGGILLGFGAMISLGCTIGTTLSGISAFAVSGWVFTLAMVLGVWTGIRWNWHR